MRLNTGKARTDNSSDTHSSHDQTNHTFRPLGQEKISMDASIFVGARRSL